MPGVNVEFRQASVTYTGEQNTVLACKDVTFSVEAGDSVALIGPSGCGKSTTLLMAAGLLEPSEGSVLVGGVPLSAPRSTTAFVPQDLGLFPWRTVQDNVALGLLFHGVPKAKARAQAHDALEAVDLVDFADAFPKDLSGGMRQRVALARALALDADLLLMDEPLSALDALSRETLQDLVLNLWQRTGATQILVTHSIEEAVYLGRTIVVFSQRPGTVIACIDNSAVGAQGQAVRDSDAFAAQCRVVRAALEGVTHE